MQSLLSHACKSNVLADPFPHIVIPNAIDEELYQKLDAEFPSLEVITQDKEFSSNQRVSYLAHKALQNSDISPLWKQFLRTQASQLFLNQFTELFGEHIQRTYPYFEKYFSQLSSLKSGVLGLDNHAMADVLMDLEISVNTPVWGNPSSVRTAHVDLPNKLFVGLFYMRSADDVSTGGDLELYRFKRNSLGKYLGWKGQYVDDKYLEAVKTVKYAPNTLVLFLNSIDSIHGVTMRSLTSTPRRFLFLAGVMNKPLFDLLPAQATPSTRLKFFRRKVKNLVLPMLP